MEAAGKPASKRGIEAGDAPGIRDIQVDDDLAEIGAMNDKQAVRPAAR